MLSITKLKKIFYGFLMAKIGILVNSEPSTENLQREDQPMIIQNRKTASLIGTRTVPYGKMDEVRLDSLDGVGPVTTKKLNDAGIHNIMDLLVRGPVDIAEITGMEFDTAAKLVTKARESLIESGQLQKEFVSATEIYKRRQDIGKISTNTNALDMLFDGGIETQAVTEVYGEFGSGKTQFCHTMCVNVQKSKEEGGLDGGVLYIDTENTFRPERIVSIAKAKGLDPAKALDRIIVAKAYNSSHQELIMQEAGTVIEENKIKLIVVDSAVGLFRSEYLGRGTLSIRQQRLNKFMHLLTRTAETYNVAAIATNQVMSSPDTFFGDPTRPIGGNVVAHSSTYRVYFKKSGKKRIARMVDSPHHPEQEVIFTLTEAGVSDPEEETKKKKKDESEE
ncbi:MAG TPA: DNA repair and recombination protein RadA [Nitrosopumilaceae archaeon]|nr:DNA repair and recombination protein RadA [Nitrosopumilaceae archaeon]